MVGRAKPVVCSRETMLALLAGRQWQRRRPVRIPAGATVAGWVRELDAQGRPVLVCSRASGRPLIVRCAYGDVDDWLWCRERWRMARVDGVRQVEYQVDSLEPDGQRWISPLLMPREAARMWLRIYDVRLQNLQELRNFDIHGEGVSCPEHDTSWSSCIGECQLLREAYARYWDASFAPATPWASNPPVWALSFTRHNATQAVRERRRLEHEHELERLEAARRRAAGRREAKRSAAKRGRARGS